MIFKRPNSYLCIWSYLPPPQPPQPPAPVPQQPSSGLLNWQHPMGHIMPLGCFPATTAAGIFGLPLLPCSAQDRQLRVRPVSGRLLLQQGGVRTPVLAPAAALGVVYMKLLQWWGRGRRGDVCAVCSSGFPWLPARAVCRACDPF